MKEKSERLAKKLNYAIIEDNKGISIETMSGSTLIYRLHRRNYENPQDIWDDVYAKLKELDYKDEW